MSYRRRHTLAGVTSQPFVSRHAAAASPILLDVPLTARALAGLESQGLARTLAGLESQGLARTLGESADGLGADEVTPTSIEQLLATQAAIKAQLDAQDRARKIALYVGVGSAIFAAVRLGLIAFPAIKAKMTR
jgi:hypothetical protein